MLLFVLPVFLVADLAQPQPLGTLPGKPCSDMNIPIIVTSTNLIWGLLRFVDNYDLTALVAAADRRDFATNLLPLFSDAEVKTAIYNISGTYCRPIQVEILRRLVGIIRAGSILPNATCATEGRLGGQQFRLGTLERPPRLRSNRRRWSSSYPRRDSHLSTARFTHFEMLSMSWLIFDNKLNPILHPLESRSTRKILIYLLHLVGRHLQYSHHCRNSPAPNCTRPDCPTARYRHSYACGLVF